MKSVAVKVVTKSSANYPSRHEFSMLTDREVGASIISGIGKKFLGTENLAIVAVMPRES